MSKISASPQISFPSFPNIPTIDPNGMVESVPTPSMNMANTTVPGNDMLQSATIPPTPSTTNMTSGLTAPLTNSIQNHIHNSRNNRNRNRNANN